MHATPDPADVWLYARAAVCRAFPGAYTLETARQANVEVFRALELLDAAAKVQTPAGR